MYEPQIFEGQFSWKLKKKKKRISLPSFFNQFSSSFQEMFLTITLQEKTLFMNFSNQKN